jgi:hypothetical protein
MLHIFNKTQTTPIIAIALFCLLLGCAPVQPTNTQTPVIPTDTSTPLTYEPSSIIHGSEAVQSPASNPPDFANDATSHELGAFDLVSANAWYGLYRKEIGPVSFKDAADFIAKMESFKNDHLKKNPSIQEIGASRDDIVSRGIMRDNGDGTYSMIFSFKADGAVAYPEPGYFDPSTTQEWINFPGRPELSIGDDKHSYTGIEDANGVVTQWLNTVGANRDNIDQQLVAVTTADSAPAAAEPAAAAAGMLNEKGDAATQIDGEWYPVDAKGCFYKEFFDPAGQKKNPEIMKLVDKINGEEPFSTLGEDIVQRHFGTTATARTNSGQLPLLNEKNVDAVIFDQSLCFNVQTNEWEHIIDYVLPSDVKQMPNDVVMMRGVVGWIKEGEYTSFTYRQMSKRATVDGRKLLRDVSGMPAQKAATISEAFSLWKDLVLNKQQVGIRTPLSVFAGQDRQITDQDYNEYVKKIASEAFQKDPVRWSENINDPEFVQWATSENNQVRYMSDSKIKNAMFVTHKSEIWKYVGEQIAEGGIPDWVIRVVEVQGE